MYKPAFFVSAVRHRLHRPYGFKTACFYRFIAARWFFFLSCVFLLQQKAFSIPAMPGTIIKNRKKHTHFFRPIAGNSRATAFLCWFYTLHPDIFRFLSGSLGMGTCFQPLSGRRRLPPFSSKTSFINHPASTARPRGFFAGDGCRRLRHFATGRKNLLQQVCRLLSVPAA